MAAGAVNALAGGGTLITFPVLLAVGLPAVAANVTNTVALCPGYLGATLAQKRDLAGQRPRMWLVLPAGAVGGLALAGVEIPLLGTTTFIEALALEDGGLSAQVRGGVRLLLIGR